MDKLISALEELNSKYPRHNLNLTLSEPYDTNNSWDHSSWPDNGLPGIYIFADENKKVLYIGKSSKSISNRLSAYWCKGDNGETKSKDQKSENVRYVYTIGIPCDRAFEAPSIEEFLIGEVQPERNTNSK